MTPLIQYLRTTLRVATLAAIACFCAPVASAEIISVSLRLPVPYCGEWINLNGTFEYGSTVTYDSGYATLPNFWVDTDDPSYSITVVCGDESAVIDHGTVQGLTDGGDLYVQLQDTDGYDPRLRLTLPIESSGQTLYLVQVDPSNGLPYNTSYVAASGTISTPDGMGGTRDILKAMVSYHPSRTYWVANLSTYKKSPESTSILHDATWVPDYSNYPICPIGVYLEAQEVGHKFTVHSFADGGAELQQSVTATNDGTGNAMLTFGVGYGMTFWISRDADGHSTDPWWNPEDDNGATSRVWNGYNIFPDPPNRTTEPRTFRIHYENRGEHAFSVLLSDGYRTLFSPSHQTATVDSWNGQPVINPLSVVTFAAWIDPTKSWWLRDEATGEEFSIGQTDILDGWNPAFAPPPIHPVIAIHLPWWHAFYSIGLTEVGSSDPIWQPTSSIAEWTVYPGLDGMEDFTLQGSYVQFNNPRPDEYGPFSFYEGTAWTPTVFPGENDFRLNFGPTQTQLFGISSSRWGHELILRHPNGDSYPVVKYATQGNVSFDPNQNAWTTSYYWFDASADYHPELPWYVEDTHTGERIGPFPAWDDLINWIAIAPPENLISWEEMGIPTLRWDAASVAVDGGFDVERRALAILAGQTAGGWTLAANLVVGNVLDSNTGLANWNDVGAVERVSYEYRVRNRYGGRRSAFSNPTTVIRDSDHDGIDDLQEIQGGLDPLKRDSDGDGTSDAEEIASGRDPLKADHPLLYLSVYGFTQP